MVLHGCTVVHHFCFDFLRAIPISIWLPYFSTEHLLTGNIDMLENFVELSLTLPIERPWQ